MTGSRPALFSGVPGGWLDVLEFMCFFRGISFCSNAGAPALCGFAPGDKRLDSPPRCVTQAILQGDYKIR